MCYFEINNEQIYDLLNQGAIIKDQSMISEERCCSIDQMISLKQAGDNFRLSSQVQLEDDDSDLFNNSTLVIKFTVENMLSEKKRTEMNESMSAH